MPSRSSPARMAALNAVGLTRARIARSSFPPTPRYLYRTATTTTASSSSSSTSSNESFLHGDSTPYMDRMYEEWQRNPAAVHISWQVFFENIAAGIQPGKAFTAPPSLQSSTSSSSTMTPSLPSKSSTTPSLEGEHVAHDTSRLIQMIRAYQTRGFESADIDPLQLPRKVPYVPSLRPEFPIGLHYHSYGFTESDLDHEIDVRTPQMTGFLSTDRQPRKLRDTIRRLQEAYCGTIGVEYMHINDQAICNFIRQAIETPERFRFDPEVKRKILVRTARAQLFENFCAAKFSTSKRFGLDGCETLIVAMKALVKKSARDGVESILLGMPHRGRLNMLTNILHKSMEKMMSEFQGVTGFSGTEWGNTGDVKYHLGVEIDRWESESQRYLHMGILANPSHLEAVDPLLVGQVKAQQYFLGDEEREKVLPVLIHGDASFAGQGVVYETLQMSQLPNYNVGGTVHIVCNNQIGFTTYPVDASSGKYCTDLAKAIDAPVFHVNADDPEAVTFVAELALKYRQTFKRDVFVDLIGYRRYGHNELDMPKFTNPHMYTKISRHPTVLEIYSKKLIKEGLITSDEIDNIKTSIFEFYSKEYDKSKNFKPSQNAYQPQWQHMKAPREFARPRETGCEVDFLRDLGEKISTLPADFNAHPTIAKTYKARQEAIASGENIDFGLGEALAYGSLLVDGFHVRLMGQDAQRGTFSHRHAVVHDQTLEGYSYCPLRTLKTPYRFEVGNSHLSEYAALGFELGYSLEHPDTLPIWEAQFGDFANGAQIIIDQFITSGEAKWTKQSGIVLLLPHGYDGQGPEHSSCKVERFLQACDDREDVIHPENFDVSTRSVIQRHNMQIVNCTTPANFFHVLRRQMHREFRKPLIVVSPKRMLKMRATFSKLEDFGLGTRFLRYIPDNSFDSAKIDKAGSAEEAASSRLENVERLVLCSGQMYYDLIATREKRRATNVAIARVEQLSPFPYDGLIPDIQRFPALRDIVWVQEEPMNMGPWFYTSSRIENSLRHLNNPNGIQKPLYVGRDVSASPAVGDVKLHQQELDRILEDCFDLQLQHNSYFDRHQTQLRPPTADKKDTRSEKQKTMTKKKS